MEAFKEQLKIIKGIDFINFAFKDFSYNGVLNDFLLTLYYQKKYSDIYYNGFNIIHSHNGINLYFHNLYDNTNNRVETYYTYVKSVSPGINVKDKIIFGKIVSDGEFYYEICNNKNIYELLQCDIILYDTIDELFEKINLLKEKILLEYKLSKNLKLSQNNIELIGENFIDCIKELYILLDYQSNKLFTNQIMENMNIYEKYKKLNQTMIENDYSKNLTDIMNSDNELINSYISELKKHIDKYNSLYQNKNYISKIEFLNFLKSKKDELNLNNLIKNIKKMFGILYMELKKEICNLNKLKDNVNIFIQTKCMLETLLNDSLELSFSHNESLVNFQFKEVNLKMMNDINTIQDKLEIYNKLITNSTNALTLEISDITQQYFNIIEMIALENFKKEQKEVFNIKQILTTFLN